MSWLFKKIFPSKEMRAFNKMHRRHRKELIKLAKETNEYDYCWLHESVIMQIKHMYEYYSAGNNVWQVDESRLKIVSQLEHTLSLIRELEKIESGDYTLELSFGENKLTKPENYHERTLDLEERVNRLYEEIYSSIGRNIRYWWD